MKNFRSLMAVIVFAIVMAVVGQVYSTPLFTPTIDGWKESGWGATPDATSAGYDTCDSDRGDAYHFSNPCRDVYITDDPDNLYIGYYYAGDNWDDGVSARLMFGFLTNTSGTSGGNADPWETTTTFGANNKPDFFLRQWTEDEFDERMEFGGNLGYSGTGTKGVAEFLKWNGSAWVGAGTVIHYERLTTNSTANNWAEIAIPLSSLGLKTGDSIKLFYYYRPSTAKPGISDSTPFDPAAASDWGDNNATLNSNFSYTIRDDNIDPVFETNHPAHTDTDISKSQNIMFRVSDNVNFDIDNITVTVEGNTAFSSGSAQSGFGVSIVTNTATKDYTITINPDSDFDYDQRINITITVVDEAGNSSEKTYYYDVVSDTTAPTYSSLNPNTGATAVARNSTVFFNINDDDQVKQSSIIAKVDGNLALSNSTFQAGYNGGSGQIIATGNGYNVTIDPTTDFNFDDSITINITAVDMSDNTNSTNYTFTITSDNIDPTAVNESPVNGANNQARNVGISCQLNDNIGVVSSTIDATVGGVNAIVNGSFQTGYSGAITVNGNGYNVYITNNSGYNYSQNVTVVLSAEDAQANSVTNNWSFTIKADSIAPILILTNGFSSPSNNQTDQEKNVDIKFTLDDDTQINILSLDVKINGQDAVVDGSSVAGYNFSQVANGNGYDCTINPDNDFNYEEAVAVFLSVEDSSANSLVQSYSFTIKPDDVKPYLTSLTPASNAINIDYTSDISLEIHDDSSVVNSSVQVKVNGSLALSNGSFSPPFDGALSEMSVSSGNIIIKLDNDTIFSFDSTNSVWVVAKDPTGNWMTNTYDFVITNDYIAPTIVDKNPTASAPNNTAITFNAQDNIQVNTDTLVITLVTNLGATTNTVVVYTNNTWESGFSSGSSINEVATNNYLVSVKSDGNYYPETGIKVYVSFDDMEGNSVSENWQFAIQASDTTTPTLSRLSPGSGADGVEPDTHIYFEIADNEQVASNTLNVFLIWPDASQPSPSKTLIVSNGIVLALFNGPATKIVTNINKGYDVTLDYTSVFAFTNIYGIQASVKDTIGNTISNTWIFTIRPPDTTPPIITNMVPAFAQENVPISASISFMVFDNYGVRTNGITVLLNGNTMFVDGQFTEGYQGKGSSISGNDQNGQNIIIDPEKDFTYGEAISITIIAVDTSSNSTTNTYSFDLQGKEQAEAKTSIIDPKRNVDKIRVKLNRTGTAKGDIYDLRGELVATLPEEYYNSGDFIEWDGVISATGEKVASGWYFIHLYGSDIDITLKVIVVK